jgi:hypothetical protein
MISRRKFLGGAAASAALIAVPTAVLAKKEPPRNIIFGTTRDTTDILYADGVHDDTMALKALVQGTPLDLGQMKSGTVRIVDGNTIRVEYAHFKVSSGSWQSHASKKHKLTFYSCIFDME